jgi:hypothetical protein
MGGCCVPCHEGRQGGSHQFSHRHRNLAEKRSQCTQPGMECAYKTYLHTRQNVPVGTDMYYSNGRDDSNGREPVPDSAHLLRSRKRGIGVTVRQSWNLSPSRIPPSEGPHCGPAAPRTFFKDCAEGSACRPAICTASAFKSQGGCSPCVNAS